MTNRYARRRKLRKPIVRQYQEPPSKWRTALVVIVAVLLALVFVVTRILRAVR